MGRHLLPVLHVALRRLRPSIGTQHVTVAGIVTGHGKGQALFGGQSLFPFAIEHAVVIDTRSNIPARFVDVGEVGILLADLFVGGRQDLHDAYGAYRTLGIGIQTRLGNALSLEPAPVDVGAEVVLGVLAEVVIVVAAPVIVGHVPHQTGVSQPGQ